MKLFRRHVQEWSTLLANQREVRRLANQPLSQQPDTATSERAVAIKLTNKYGTRYDHLLTRQSLDRQQMMVRHKEEEAALEQILNQ